MSGDGSFMNVNFHIGSEWRTYCHTYVDRTPILSVDAGRSAVSISVRDRNAGEAAVEFARALVRDAQLFAAEVERLHAAQLADDSNSKAADNGAA